MNCETKHLHRRLILMTPLALALGGCSSAPKIAIGPKVSFNWSAPAACETSGSIPVTFAVVSPVWQKVGGTGTLIDAYAAQNPQWLAYVKPRKDLYDEFASSMRNDFFALLTCKGYTTKGPFASSDDMVFPDRMASDLTLAPEIDLRLAVNADVPEPGWGQIIGLSIMKRGASESRLKGTASLSGRVTIAVRESVTDTRMWTRSIEVPTESFEFVTENSYPETAKPLYSEVVTGDPAFLRALAPKLSIIYQKALSTAWNYTNSQEMRIVKSQSQEPRKKAITSISR